MEPNNEDLQINGKIVSMSTEGVVADASQIYDDGMLKYANTGKQSDINQYFETKVDTLTGGVNNINNRIDNTNTRIDNIPETRGIPLDVLSQILTIG